MLTRITHGAGLKPQLVMLTTEHASTSVLSGAVAAAFGNGSENKGATFP